jgi:N-acetylneuraminic acid mutarotase
MGLMRTETGAAFAAGKLYVIGGGLAIAESSSLVQEYDPRTDRWRERAALPMPLSHGGVAALNKGGVAALNNKVYVVGGFLKNVHLYAQPYAFEYDPAKNTWRTLPWMKAARGSVGVVALKGTIQSAPFLPEPRSGGSAVLYHDRILLMGGECDGTKTFSQNEAYDPKTMRWTALAAMPGGRHGFCAVTDGRAVYVAGGSPNCGGGSSDTLMLFTSPTGGTS